MAKLPNYTVGARRSSRMSYVSYNKKIKINEKRILIQKPFNLIVSLAFAVNAARYSGVPRDILLMPSQTHETAL